jgi:hypothetical protein
MAKKKDTSPVITNTETICYAIKAIQAEIDVWKNKAADKEEMAEMVAVVTAPLNEKVRALMMLYKIETGVDHNDTE